MNFVTQINVSIKSYLSSYLEEQLTSISAQKIVIRQASVVEPLRRLPPAAVLAGLAVLYGPFYWQHDARAQAPLTADSAEFHALLAELRENPPGTRLIARNPRIFALYAGLPSHTWPETLTPEGWRATLATYRPAYVIEERWQTSEEATTLAALVATYPVSFENAAYRLRAIPAAALGR